MSNINEIDYINDPFRSTSTNYLLTNSFHFVLARIPKLTDFIQAVNIPQVSMNLALQPTTLGKGIYVPTGSYYFDDLQIQFIVDADFTIWEELFDWMILCGNMYEEGNAGLFKNMFSEATTTVKTPKGNILKIIRYHNVIPRSIGQIPLSTTVIEAEPILCSSTFFYSHYTLEDPQ